MSNVDCEPAPVVIQRHYQARRGESSERQKRKPGKPVRALPRSQAAARHSQKASDQNNIREELKENNRGREPANTGQFQEQNQKSDQEKIEAGLPHIELFLSSSAKRVTG